MDHGILIRFGQKLRIWKPKGNTNMKGSKGTILWPVKLKPSDFSSKSHSQDFIHLDNGDSEVYILGHIFSWQRIGNLLNYPVGPE